jgi:TonB family protein
VCRGFPLAHDFYSAASARHGESGIVDVRACVGTDGALTAQPTVVRSSRSRTLDEAALRLARAGSGKYVPATENGEPVSCCFVFRVNFVIKGPVEPSPSTDGQATESGPPPALNPKGAPVLTGPMRVHCVRENVEALWRSAMAELRSVSRLCSSSAAAFP